MPFFSSVRATLGSLGSRRRVLPPQATFRNYFGNGSDGALSTSGDVTLTVPNKSGSYNGDYYVAQYTSLTVNSGHTLTVDQPCKGLFIYVDGNCTINGTISMRGKGAAQNPDSILNSDGIQYPVATANGSATLSAADFAGCGSGITTAVANQPSISSDGAIIRISKRGASGGAAVTSSSGNAGGAGGAPLSSSIVTVTLGGGGGGGHYSDANSCNPGCSPGGLQDGISYRGGNATAFSGGPGGGGKMSGLRCRTAGSAGDDNGGTGGNGDNGHCGGTHGVAAGVGNPGGTDRYGSTSQPGNNQSISSAQSGTGGVVWLVVKGTLTIGASGVIDVRGTDNTETGRGGIAGNVYGAGGGSGAGAAILLHGGSLSNSGTINKTGGAGYSVVASGAGGNGGIGSICILPILNT